MADREDEEGKAQLFQQGVSTFFFSNVNAARNEEQQMDDWNIVGGAVPEMKHLIRADNPQPFTPDDGLICCTAPRSNLIRLEFNIASGRSLFSNHLV